MAQNSIEHKTLELDWVFVISCIEKELSKIIGKDIHCKIWVNACDYWAVQIMGYRLTLDELEKIFEATNSSEEARKRTLPADGEDSVMDLDMDVSSDLLSMALNKNWKYILVDENLWLISVTDKQN